MFDKLIPSQTEILIRLHRKPLNFSLMAKKEFKLKILDAKISTNRVRLNETSASSYERLLSSRGFLYPTLNVVTRTKTVSKGDQNVDWIPFNGPIPRRIYFFQISQKAFNNDLELNPFNFKPFKVDKVQVFKNGLSLPSAQGMHEIQESKYLKCYLQTFRAINSPNYNISYTDFMFGYMVIAVDITNDQSSGCGYDNPQASGTLRISIDYKEPLTEPVTLFCVGENVNAFELNADRNITWINQ
jgi:hypothetical protein